MLKVSPIQPPHYHDNPGPFSQRDFVIRVIMELYPDSVICPSQGTSFPVALSSVGPHPTLCHRLPHPLFPTTQFLTPGAPYYFR